MHGIKVRTTVLCKWCFLYSNSLCTFWYDVLRKVNKMYLYHVLQFPSPGPTKKNERKNVKYIVKQRVSQCFEYPEYSDGVLINFLPRTGNVSLGLYILRTIRLCLLTQNCEHN